MICPKCGAEINDTNVFCSNCGERVIASSPAEPVQPSEEPQIIERDFPAEETHENQNSEIPAGYESVPDLDSLLVNVEERPKTTPSPDYSPPQEISSDFQSGEPEINYPPFSNEILDAQPQPQPYEMPPPLFMPDHSANSAPAAKPAPEGNKLYKPNGIYKKTVTKLFIPLLLLSCLLILYIIFIPMIDWNSGFIPQFSLTEINENRFFNSVSVIINEGFVSAFMVGNAFNAEAVFMWFAFLPALFLLIFSAVRNKVMCMVCSGAGILLMLYAFISMIAQYGAKAFSYLSIGAYGTLLLFIGCFVLTFFTTKKRYFIEKTDAEKAK